jgi:hypothetical protein
MTHYPSLAAAVATLQRRGPSKPPARPAAPRQTAEDALSHILTEQRARSILQAGPQAHTLT